MFVELPSYKVVQIIPISWKTRPTRGGACFAYSRKAKTVKIKKEKKKSTGPIWK